MQGPLQAVLLKFWCCLFSEAVLLRTKEDHMPRNSHYPTHSIPNFQELLCQKKKRKKERLLRQPSGTLVWATLLGHCGTLLQLLRMEPRAWHTPSTYTTTGPQAYAEGLCSPVCPHPAAT
ncbi:hypothetical protein H1C71_007592 [Ictidomys tridecemlineatus]|nr:hypothetical protein H1C71_007592 [Ictidomys tridecemlineatus]